MTGGQVAGAAPGLGRTPEVWGQVPQRNINFTGRERLLEELSSSLTNQVKPTAVLPHALHGLGGVGKTQVAVEYAHRMRSSYEVVWWIPADQPALIRSSLAAMAPHLGLPPATATGIGDAAAAVLEKLRLGEPYAKWLLVFDNADQPEDILTLIPPGPGHVLVTSRNHRWKAVVETVSVNVFSREESVEFLIKRVPKAINGTTANLLAAELGDLPLALEQAGALQAETSMSAQQYLQLLSEKTQDLLAESKPSEYPVSMTAAWQISMAKLTEIQPASLELLRCCAFFGPEPIPRDVFRRGIQPTGSQLSKILSDPILLARVIRDLGRLALATIDPATRTIQVHRLIQALLRDEILPEERSRFRHEVHLLLAAAAPTDPNNESRWPDFAALVAHIIPPQVARCQNAQVRNFALSMVRYLYWSGDYASSRMYAEMFLKQWTEDSGEDNPEVLIAQWYLGDVLRDLGDFRAAYDLTGPALDRARRVLGPEHEATLALAMGFGADVRAHGDFAAARDRDEDSVRVCETALGPTAPRTLLARNSLALDYGLVSDYKTARELHKQTYMEQSQASSGVSKVDVLTSWSGLSRAVRLAGEYNEARILAEDAYDYGRQELGSDHPWTLRTGKELSIALRLAGELPDSIVLARDLLERSKRFYGDDHPDTLATATALANSLRTIGQVDEAFVIATDVSNRYASIYGADHPYVHACAGNLALLLRLRGDSAAAQRLNDLSLTGLEAKAGRDHDYPLTVAINLASDFATLGEAHIARELGEDTLTRLRKVLGVDHPVTLGCAANLVLDLRSDGEEGKAAELAQDTIDRFSSSLGKEHPDTDTARLGQRFNFDFDPPPI